MNLSHILIFGGLIAAAGLYLALGWFHSKRLRRLSDLLPLEKGRFAAVESSTEFSASTVAATVSLATVILAFFQLAPYLGMWLLWTVITTAMGILAVRFALPRMRSKLNAYQPRIPTLHAFLGDQYNAAGVKRIGALCTSIGFLGAFAVELTVGSRFLAGLIPEFPTLLTAMLLAVVVLIYTSAGGFRTVIVTDRLQMFSIWAFMAALMLFYIYFAVRHGGLSVAFSRVPKTVYDFSNRDGLIAFLIGIFIINVPTFLADMSMWQRLSSVRDPKSALTGTLRSSLSALFTWLGLALLACLAPMAISHAPGSNPLADVLNSVMNPLSSTNAIVLLVSVIGLYGANLSTGSTQLIAISHTVHEDLLATSPLPPALSNNTLSSEFRKARLILVVSAIVAIGVVEFLSAMGFSIADLVFSIYGAQLGLCPVVAGTLFFNDNQLKRIGKFASFAIGFGFVSGWTSAFLGKAITNDNLVFLSPGVSLLISSLILAAGFFIKNPKSNQSTAAIGS